MEDIMVNSPASAEYTFSFGGGILGDYAPGQQRHLYTLLGTNKTPNEVLAGLEMPENLLKQVEFKVMVGERLKEAVLRVLKEELGLEDIFSFEYRFSKKRQDLVYVRVVCRNSDLNGRTFRGLYLYWYQIE
jgi:hypothetical protein